MKQNMAKKYKIKPSLYMFSKYYISFVSGYRVWIFPKDRSLVLVGDGDCQRLSGGVKGVSNRHGYNVTCSGSSKSFKINGLGWWRGNKSSYKNNDIRDL